MIAGGLLQELTRSNSIRGAFDHAALVAHSTMLEHGFVCLGTAEPTAGASPKLTIAADGSAVMQVLPTGWNASADSFTFGYIHPSRGSSEGFTLKALVIGSSLVIHAASSVPGTDLLTVTFNIAAEKEVTPSDVQGWQEKMLSGIVLRLLARQPSTARLGKALDASEPSTNTERGNATKRPAPEDPRTQPRPSPESDFDDRRPGLIDPFHPGFPSPPLWTPYGGSSLIGPRHPAWGQVGPGGRPLPGGGAGMMPRFDPTGPFGDGTMEPNPDHLRVPGMFPGNFPAFQGGATGGRRDPDGMFIL